MDLAELAKTYGIALTGGIATGKSTVARLISQMGYVVIDADALAREVVAPGSDGLAKICDTFGKDYISKGQLDRPRLKQLIFSDPSARQQLEAITHPLIHEALEQRLKQHGLFLDPRPWFYEAALIFEKGRHQDFRAVWTTFCPTGTQIRRLMARDQIDQTAAENIIRNQMPSTEKTALAQAVIRTNVASASLESQIKGLLENLS